MILKRNVRKGNGRTVEAVNDVFLCCCDFSMGAFAAGPLFLEAPFSSICLYNIPPCELLEKGTAVEGLVLHHC